jgi:hypothetical protein
MFYLNLLSWGIVTTGFHSWNQWLFLGKFLEPSKGKKERFARYKLIFFRKMGSSWHMLWEGNKSIVAIFREKVETSHQIMWEILFFFYLGQLEPLAEFCYLTLRLVSSLHDSQNNEMKFCNNMKLTCWKSS